jgi:aldehyde dehydrogenase family 7 protein A1
MIKNFKCNRFSKKLDTFQFQSRFITEVRGTLGLADFNIGVYNGSWERVSKSHINKQYNPSTKEILGEVSFGSLDDFKETKAKMKMAKQKWALTPPPVRGEIVRKIGDELRRTKKELGMLVSLEMGKIYSEGLGEVQEAIDICDFATGLSRCLNGSVIPSERPAHYMMER